MGKLQTKGVLENIFNGPIIPFGSLVEYYPFSAKDQCRIHQFGKKVVPGFFLGYALYAGGTWKGDILVADIEELEQMDASEIYAKRLNAKEVLTPLSGEKFIFPVADGTVKLSVGDQVLRQSTLIWDRPDRGEEQGNLQGAPDGSSSTPLPRVTLYVPREESFPIPLKNSTLPGLRIHPWMKCWRRTSMTIETLMDIENCQIPGPVSQDSPY